MNTIRTSQEIDYERRRFLGAAAMTIFGRSAIPFDDPELVEIVIHHCRWRIGLAEGEAQYDDLEKRLAAGPVITVPTITMEGDANGAPHPATRPIAINSRANMNPGSSQAASGAICVRKRRRHLPKL
jgi:hypothetical protein